MKIKYKKYSFLTGKDTKIQKTIFISFLYMFLLTSCLDNKTLTEKKFDPTEQKSQKELNNNPQNNNNNNNTQESKSIIDSSSDSDPDTDSDSDSNSDPNPNSESEPDYESDSDKEQVIEKLKKNIYEIRELKEKYSIEVDKQESNIIYNNANSLANEIFEFVSKLENPSLETLSILNESAQELNSFIGPKNE